MNNPPQHNGFLAYLEMGMPELRQVYAERCDTFNRYIDKLSREMGRPCRILRSNPPQAPDSHIQLVQALICLDSRIALAGDLEELRQEETLRV